MSEALFVLSILGTAAFLIAWQKPDFTETWVSRISTTALAFWSLVAILFAIALLSSNQTHLVVIGAVIVVYTGLKIWFGWGQEAVS